MFVCFCPRFLRRTAGGRGDPATHSLLQCFSERAWAGQASVPPPGGSLGLLYSGHSCVPTLSGSEEPQRLSEYALCSLLSESKILLGFMKVKLFYPPTQDVGAGGPWGTVCKVSLHTGLLII